jgi:hypothetical protein
MRIAPFALFALGLSAALARPADTPSAEEDKAITAIDKLGAKAAIDPGLSPDARVCAKFESATDKLLTDLKKQPRVGAVEIFDATKCTDKGFAALRSLPHLRKLVVGKAALKPEAVTAISYCKELRYLALTDCGVTDGELVSLKRLTLLEHLTLSDNPKVGDKGMASVKTLDRLQVLYLSNTGITNKGLVELKVLDGLRTLNVTNTKVTADAAEQFVEDMPNLRIVRR